MYNNDHYVTYNKICKDGIKNKVELM